MQFPNPCCRCGFCCLSTQCPISITIYGEKAICPALSFYEGVSVCEHAKSIVPIGDGCCINGRAYKDGVEYDFASLPAELKFNATMSLIKRRGLLWIVSVNTSSK